MKSGTFTNNTSFSATAASVAVPSGSTTITVKGYNSASFTVPNGVRVVSVDGRYVGVTPNKTYSLGGWIPFIHHSGEEGEPFCKVLAASTGMEVRLKITQTHYLPHLLLDGVEPLMRMSQTLPIIKDCNLILL